MGGVFAPPKIALLRDFPQSLKVLVVGRRTARGFSGEGIRLLTSAATSSESAFQAQDRSQKKRGEADKAGVLCTQMYPPVVTKDPTAVEAEAQSAFLTIFPNGDCYFVPRVFGWAIEAFTGNYRDYQAVDAYYHDFEHTLQGTLCFVRLLRGRHLAGDAPVLTPRVFQLGLAAILLHDTGYLKKRDDRIGTGAKYTVTHVERSAEFARAVLEEKSFSAAEIKAVQNMILCTGVDSKLAEIPFQSEIERMVGFALATADLLGQMAAEDYVDKLPVLYAEFVEAVNFSKNKNHFIASFTSAEDLMRRTPSFWRDCVRVKLEKEYEGLYRFLNTPYPDGPNEYVERIEANMARLERSEIGAAIRPESGSSKREEQTSLQV